MPPPPTARLGIRQESNFPPKGRQQRRSPSRPPGGPPPRQGNQRQSPTGKGGKWRHSAVAEPAGRTLGRRPLARRFRSAPKDCRARRRRGGGGMIPALLRGILLRSILVAERGPCCSGFVPDAGSGCPPCFPSRGLCPALPCPFLLVVRPWCASCVTRRVPVERAPTHPRLSQPASRAAPSSPLLPSGKQPSLPARRRLFPPHSPPSPPPPLGPGDRRSPLPAVPRLSMEEPARGTRLNREGWDAREAAALSRSPEYHLALSSRKGWTALKEI